MNRIMTESLVPVLRRFFLMPLLFVTTASGQTYTPIVYLNKNTSYNPTASLVQGIDGNLFGTTEHGISSDGKIFETDGAGGFRALKAFTGADGEGPSGLTQADDGSLWGTTLGGGSKGVGVVFELTPQNVLKIVHNFDESTGGYPTAGVVQGTDENFYGTTFLGGNSGCSSGPGCGSIFKMSPSGKFSTLHEFSGTDGSAPNGPLVQHFDGSFYGTTSNGGVGTYCPTNQLCGTVFKISSSGKLTTIYNFCSQLGCADGYVPYAGLTLGTDGNLYGTTIAGGGMECDGVGCGIVFKITTKGILTVLYSFSEDNGAYPYAGLVEGSDGYLYGVAYAGGISGGTVFKVNKEGGGGILYNFQLSTGIEPLGALMQDTSGVFYGTTSQGGLQKCVNFVGCGVIFKFDMELGPFVTFIRNYGKVGQASRVLGQGFIGTTSVTLNGVPASFKVISDTYLVATVPPGATTGYVTVTTPTGVLTSNKKFVVLP